MPLHAVSDSEDTSPVFGSLNHLSACITEDPLSFSAAVQELLAQKDTSGSLATLLGNKAACDHLKIAADFSRAGNTTRAVTHLGIVRQVMNFVLKP